MQEVTLTDILQARDTRAARQKELIREYGQTLLSFCMNIAGPIKNSPLIRRGFEEGNKLLLSMLQASGCVILHKEYLYKHTGNEALLVVEGDAKRIKKICCEIEDFNDLGRLYDIDVIAANGQKLDREHIGFPTRACLLCEQSAKHCARSRTHGVEELWNRYHSILQDALHKADAKKIAEQAVKALLYEVTCSPKPGLVDRSNSGSHKDMDIFTYIQSSISLYDYFHDCAAIGQKEYSPTQCFELLCLRGRRAEAEMLQATKGVNTHKGAIFSLGIVCAASARVGYKSWKNTESVLSECKKMLCGMCGRAFGQLTKETAQSTGEKLYLQYGIRGARGQAEEGFPTVANLALPKLKEALQQGYSENDAGAIALLYIIANECDTNMIHRGGYALWQEESERLRQLLSHTPYPSKEQILALDTQYISQNLSPGGSADLLALCYFLYFLEQE